MANRTASALMCLVLAVTVHAPPPRAATATTSTTETIVVLATTTATMATTRPAVATPVPEFDQWAAQPSLRCSLPAIGSWETARHVPAQTRESRAAKSPVQIIFAQRPQRNPGGSKYTVIYKAADLDPTDRIQRRIMATTYWAEFRKQVEKSGRFGSIDVTTPVVTASGDLWRLQFDYRLQTNGGTLISGAVFALPARRGMLFFNLTLQGQEPEAVETAMRELRVLATVGLARRTWSVRPYLIGAILVLPILAAGVVLLKRRRAADANSH